MQTHLRKLPKQGRGISKIDTILLSAEDLFAEDGYDATSTDMIAKNAGISIGSLYQFFPNKKAILEELTERYLFEYAKMSTPFFNIPQSKEKFIAFLEILTETLFSFNDSHKCFQQLFNTPSYSTDVVNCSKYFHETIKDRIIIRLELIMPQMESNLLRIYMDISIHMMAGMMSFANNSEYNTKHIIKSEVKRMLIAFWIPLYEKYS